ncbi:MAG TPA: lysophospholipid acyltransferase family protein [Candidatus Obscuribacterales bacterium]
MVVFLSVVYAIYWFAACALLVPLAAILALLSPIFDPDKRTLKRFCDAYTYRVCTGVSPFWTFSFEGLTNLDSGGPFVMVANHQSLADIVVLSNIRHHFRWVAKQSIFCVPFLGCIMSLNGHVAIHRGTVSSARHMLEQCSQLLNRGISVMMFPEGTRSPDGKVHDFKDGPFRLAVRNGVAVVPIAIVGTSDLVAKGSIKMNFHARVTVKILPPVAVASYQGNSAELRNHVHALIEQAVEEMRSRNVRVETAVAAS